jgi:hypothetical protein
VVNVIEIDVSEERMSFDCFSIIFARAKTPDRIPQQQLEEKYMSVHEHAYDWGKHTLVRRETASPGIDIGYKGSSSRMASKMSSSSSPLKGDCPSNISYVSTPNAHQSTARV